MNEFDDVKADARPRENSATPRLAWVRPVLSKLKAADAEIAGANTAEAVPATS
ncbi:MAG: hypothetical protein KGO02_07405 [Alphaproteobacteria bacterium]|nr:hypothetical protein [Alphaproteobacteria bacterium]